MGMQKEYTVALSENLSIKVYRKDFLTITDKDTFDVTRACSGISQSYSVDKIKELRNKVNSVLGACSGISQSYSEELQDKVNSVLAPYEEYFR
jgi:hypothetical protein